LYTLITKEGKEIYKMQIWGAVVGFLAGFIMGLMVINIMLKDKTKQELRTNKELQRKYGGLNWLIAIVVAVCGWYVFPMLFE
jgi:UDP-N-acetylmuramyl pentapeptide phosphotransferase/UDP-N-acetylglucosamine-1-phosphate transferase